MMVLPPLKLRDASASSTASLELPAEPFNRTTCMLQKQCMGQHKDNNVAHLTVMAGMCTWKPQHMCGLNPDPMLKCCDWLHMQCGRVKAGTCQRPAANWSALLTSWLSVSGAAAVGSAAMRTGDFKDKAVEQEQQQAAVNQGRSSVQDMARNRCDPLLYILHHQHIAGTSGYPIKQPINLKL